MEGRQPIRHWSMGEGGRQLCARLPWRRVGHKATHVGWILAAKPTCDSRGPKEKTGDERGDTRWWGELAAEQRARRH